MRRPTSSDSESLKTAGAERSELSRNSITSALLRAGRLLVPLKMTSSMPAARNDLCEVSPMTQRSASTRLDLPQPFGPTTPVRPCSIWKSVGSTKDLNPSRRSLLSFIRYSALSTGHRPETNAAPPRSGIFVGACPQRTTCASESGRGCRVARENESMPPAPQQGLLLVPCRIIWGFEGRQLLSSGWISLSRSSIDAPPFCILPLTNRVGVDSTLYSL